MHIRPTYRDETHGCQLAESTAVFLEKGPSKTVSSQTYPRNNVAKYSSEKVPKLFWRFCFKKVYNVMYNLH
jgi:hypothetical protein